MNSNSNKHIKLLKREQIKGILEQSPTNILANTIVASLSFWAFYNPISDHANYQIIWISIVLIISSFQTIEIRRITKTSLNSESGYRLLNGSIIVSFIIGILWSLFIFLFFELDNNSTYLMAALVCGMLAGAIGSTSIFLPLYLLFSAPLIIAFVTELINSDNKHYFSLALLMVVYYFMCVNMAYLLNKRVKESFFLRFENFDVLQQLKEQKQIAENANIAKSKFLAATSHDLRQPLHALGFFIDALKISPDKSKELFNKIDSSIASLKGLFDSLLDISKLDSGIITVVNNHFNSKDLTRQLQNEFTDKAKQKGITLNICHDNFIIYSDQELLKRLIGNLLSNAIRYTNLGEVSLTLSPYVNEEGDSLIAIKIKDTGIGIDENEIDNVFDEFYQLNNPERDRNNGLGLGLAIVKKLALLLDINLNVFSKLNIGTEFDFYIRQGSTNKVVKEKPIMSYQNKELLGKKIIIIDDEVEILNAMKYSLTNWGCEVLICESKEQAIEEIIKCEFSYDLIISDLRLRKNETGIDAINSIFDLTGQRKPALLVTGDTSPECITRVKESGFKLMHKPLKPAQLRLQLINLLRK